MTDNEHMNDGNRRHESTRRAFLASGVAGGAALLAGCQFSPSTKTDDGGTGSVEVPSLTEFRGSGALVRGRPAPGGTSITELPDLSGSLNLYIGGGEGGIYYKFVEMLEDIYPEFTVFASDAGSASLAQTVVEEVEAGAAQADVFWSIDASSLGYVADHDAYEPLPDEVVSPVPSAFQGADNAWVGVAGRARSVPYNTEQLSAEDVPNKVRQFP
ncbi:MAG: iron ABC transporter substrate-binding protein, partial [Haloarculaceae archaeon]